MAEYHKERFPTIPVPGRDLAHYTAKYSHSIDHSDEFWAAKARELISWYRPFDLVQQGGFVHGDIAWFIGGKLNACYNCIDRHLPTRGDQTAIIWEGDEPGDVVRVSYLELFRKVCQIANMMKSYGIKKGDVVTIYMPMMPETAMVMLACSRIGAIHSVVFAGFSASSLSDRIMDGRSRFIFTADEGKRGGKIVPLKQIVDSAIETCHHHHHQVERVFVFQRTNNPGTIIIPNRDVVVDDDVINLYRPYHVPEMMDSEDAMFILYTSGSTGKPKGLLHTTGGYLVYAAMTITETFDLRNDDIFACVADVGWITGHSYVIYGPLLSGSTTVLFESTPLYPNHLRYWDMIDRLRVTQFYTSPTAIRSLMKFNADGITGYNLSSLRVLGSVGEPINPEAWRWYYHHIGRGRCNVVDTYWQTETGGHLATPLPGVHDMVPGACMVPMYGIQLAVLDATTGIELNDDDGVSGVLTIARPWPGIARTIYNDHERYLNTYMRPYPGFYFTSDGAKRDADDGHYWITGRVDDVINPSGHRLGTAEVESALVGTGRVAEAAVVGFPHDVKGEGIAAYVILMDNHNNDNEADVTSMMKNAVREAIGPFATPDMIIITPGLPKTRSGKIMRRILRKLLSVDTENDLGDTSTLADPGIVDVMKGVIHTMRETK